MAPAGSRPVEIPTSLLDEYTEWSPLGACRNHPDLNWFAEGVGIEAQAERRLTKFVCNTECKVKEQCLTWALQHEEHGIWGGTSERERKKIRRQRRMVLESPQRLTAEIRGGILSTGGPSEHLFATIGDPRMAHIGDIA